MKRKQKVLFHNYLNRRAALLAAVALAVIGGVIGLHLSSATPTDQPLGSLAIPNPTTAYAPGKAPSGPESVPVDPDLHRSHAAGDIDDYTAPVQPLTGDQLNSANSIICDGDGQSDKRVQVLYVRSTSQPSKFVSYAASFQEYLRRANLQVLKSSLQNGGEPRTIHFVTTTDCKVDIREAVIPDASIADEFDIEDALKGLGYTRTDRKYMDLVDGFLTGNACGRGSRPNDDQPGPANLANSGPTFGHTGNNCWGRTSTEAHELMHNLGAVSPRAPHTDGADHCLEAFDSLCYAGEQALTYNCPVSHTNLFDCNSDDYFNSATNIPASNYLSSHWNVANSEFLVHGGSPNSADTVKPIISEFYRPSETTVSGNTTFNVMAADSIGVTRVDFQLDALPIHSETETLAYADGDISEMYYAVTYAMGSLTNGSHTVKATAYDADGNASRTVTKTVTVTGGITPPPTPPPTTPPPTTPPPTTPPPTPPGKTGDLNSDNKINLTDLSILLSNWGKTGTGDINKSGKVDLTDLSMLLSNWGK